jgi:hypothetical protein
MSEEKTEQETGFKEYLRGLKERLAKDTEGYYVAATAAGLTLAVVGRITHGEALLVVGTGVASLGIVGVRAEPETQKQLLDFWKKAAGETLSLEGTKRAVGAFRRVFTPKKK